MPRYLSQELSEVPSVRSWITKIRTMVPKLVFAIQILNKEHLSYLFDLIPKVLSTRITKNLNTIPLISVKYEYFRNSFYPPIVIKWNKLHNDIQNSESVVLLKSKSLNLPDQVLKVRLMCTILMELNCLQDYALYWIVYVNRNLDTIFKVP